MREFSATTSGRNGRHVRTWASALVFLSVYSTCARETGHWPFASQWQGGSAPKTESSRVRSGSPAPSQWLVLDTGGSGGMFGKGDIRQDLLDVAFWNDGRHGAACGDAGAFYTSDGGLTWQRILPHPRIKYPGETGVRYYAVGLSGPGDVWVAEGKHPNVGRHLWHSTDAGKTWEDAAKRFPGKFESVWGLLVRGKNVWLLGGWHPRASYRSEDDGKTWGRLALPKDLEPYRAVTPLNTPPNRLGLVYLLGARRVNQERTPSLFRTNDAGRTWQAVPLPANLPWQFHRSTISFTTASEGWIGLVAPGLKSVSFGVWRKDPGANPAVLYTQDGGATWVRRELPGTEWYITSLCLLESGHGFAAVWNSFLKDPGGPRDGPALYETFDAGRSWVVALRGKKHFNDIFALDANRVWAVGDVPGFVKNDLVAILTRATEARQSGD